MCHAKYEKTNIKSEWIYTALWKTWNYSQRLGVGRRRLTAKRHKESFWVMHISIPWMLVVITQLFKFIKIYRALIGWIYVKIILVNHQTNKILSIPSVEEDMEQLIPSSTTGANGKWHNPFGKKSDIKNKVKHTLIPTIPFPVYPREVKTSAHTNIYKWLFILALFITVPNWE